MRGSHKMATERVSVAIKGGKQRREKNGVRGGGDGGGEKYCGGQKPLGRHLTKETANR